VGTFFSSTWENRYEIMRTLTWFTALIAAPLAVLAVPADKNTATRESHSIRANKRVPAPQPCERMNPPPSEQETRARFAQFVQVFVGSKKSISKAFEFITADYIVCVAHSLIAFYFSVR
jgi:hypothetical protein